jgi:hypothetical protein
MKETENLNNAETQALNIPVVSGCCEHQCNFGKDLDEQMIYGDKYAKDHIMCKKDFDKTGWYSSCDNCNCH